MGILRIVGTPIGNLEDISLRALRTFKEADFILCEDTRVTKRLLDYYKIKTPTVSYHQHSGELKIEKVLSLLREGKNLALVTDAGTPGISDPGGKLVSLARLELGESLKVESVPGPSALATAISIAGAGFDRFLFLGFLPHKKGRQTMLKEIISSEHSVVVYESKHRAAKFLSEIIKLEKELKIEKEIIVARELTKMFESLYFGSATSILEKLQADTHNLKGEFVILIKQKTNKKNKDEYGE
ncbi:MAG: 16S rRNA (cytidine(1402)-2'-O)-methyltransferase [Patescibacteria group bacterium]